MKRHLHMFEGIVARFDQVTLDRRVIRLPDHMRESRVIATRPLPLPLYQQTPPLEAGFWPIVVGGVTSVHETGARAMAVSGVLDLNALDAVAREALMSGAMLAVGVELDQVEQQRDGDDLETAVLHLLDWRVTALSLGRCYHSAWADATYIKLQTGYYADLTKMGLDT